MLAIEKGIINSTTGKRMKELESKLEELEKKLLVEKSKVSVKLTEKDIREFFVQALNLEPKLLISYLVKEVRLFDDKVEIQFNSPINKSPDDSQGFLFYTASRKMPYTIINKPQPKLNSVKVEIYI